MITEELAWCCAGLSGSPFDNRLRANGISCSHFLSHHAEHCD